MPPRQARIATPETEEERAWRWTLWVVFAVTVARLVWLALDRVDLTPDEARLWVWAQIPAWSYPGLPPLSAWLVALTGGVFGDSAPAVRLGAPLLNFLAALLVYRSAALLYDVRVASWAAIAFVTLPTVSLSSAIVSSEAPTLFFWSLALYALLRARAGGDRRWWLLVGVAIGLGLLANYAMIEWLACAAIYVGAAREARRQWSYLAGAAALGLAIAAPSLIGGGMQETAGASAPLLDADALWEFFLAQFVVFGPLLFAVLIALIAMAARTLADPRAALLASFVLPPLALALGLSLVSHAGADAAVPAYIAASVLVVAWLRANGRQNLISVSIGLHVAAALLVGMGPRDVAALAGIELPLGYDPLAGGAGWRRLGRAVAPILRQYPGAVLMTDDRGLFGELVFYVEPHPLNAVVWSGDAAIGGDVLLVTRDIEGVPAILARFATVGPPQTITIFLGRAGTVSKPEEQRRYAVYFLQGFKAR